ncbi:hypothetical protein RMSM_05396 [Rhodopirellula maiorica SM1]|uniref:Baseplate protein J-like domain-containing protein n=1 Tax=Rhodopirellula maiorica SM1 TaxID=1265738 RepID=M5RE64_9BACT|nr:hypothetical protein RMSM_05396 [Rhodopirellula maiorica SM1]
MANRLETQKALYWKTALGTPTTTTSDLLIGLDPTPATVADDGQVFQNIQASQRPMTGVTEYKAQLEVSDGITLNSMTSSGSDLPALQTALEGIVRTSDAPGGFASYIGYKIIDDHVASTSFLTAGVHVVKTDGSIQTYFNNLRPERILLYPTSSNTPISVGFLEGTDLTFSDSTVATADPDLDINIQIVDGGGTLSTVSSPANIAGLNAELGALTYTPPDSTPRRVVIKLTISGPDDMGIVGVRAIAIRTLILDAGPKFVRRGLARALNTPASLTALKNAVADTQTAITDIGGLTAQKGALKNAVDKNLSISNTVLRADLALDAPNAALNTKIADIRTELTGYASHPKYQFIKTDSASQTVDQIASSIPANPATTSAIDQFEDKYDECKVLLAAELVKVIEVRDGTGDPPTAMFALANRIKTSLHERREKFVDQLKRAKTAHESKFDTTKPPDDSAKDAMDTLFLATGNVSNSLLFRINEFNKTLKSDSTITQVQDSESTIDKLYQLAVHILGDKPAEPDLTDDAKDAVSLIKARWEAAKVSVSGFGGAITDPLGGTDPTVTTAQDILRRLLATGGQLSVADARIVLNVINKESQLWAQIIAALNPDRRSDILADFRNFRNVSIVPRVDVWVFRSQANVFGWNSPGKLVKKPFGTPPIDQVVLDRDAADLLPVEKKDEICLDGKLKDTLSGTPIGIRRENDDDPQPYWIERVSFAPRTEYELSGDTTQVKLRTEWWSDLPASPLHDQFKTIRKTKVWCNAERLELAESILSDDTLHFRVATPITLPILELNDFYPFFSAGMQVVVSGIPAPDALPRDIRRPTREDPDANIQSEVATVVQVFHDFNESLYGDPMRTKVTLLQPIKQDYWRDTVRIAANVVSATHGETVLETLGGGDARRRFQRFTLNSSPLTRLPTADIDGQAEQIDLFVNKIHWQSTDRLLQHDGQSDRYEIRSTREGTTRVQFGDGVHGSRLASGQDNVRTSYRIGIGRAGNVDVDRIDQLPAPPLGVRAVSNPVAGDGGADPDSVRQSKPRIPLAPIRAARLISQRDYESFALLFAGVDKARAIADNGAVRLVVGGIEPGPLRIDGLLMHSLIEAIGRYGDPNVPVIVVPHSGKLLYVEATLQIDPRAPFKLVKAAVRARLVENFGYHKARLGQGILASDVVDTIQSVEHVDFVKLTRFDGITAEEAGQDDPTSSVRLRSRVPVEPGEVCYVAYSVDNTIVLEPAS